MIASYWGDGCFRLQSGETSILVNPTNNRLKASIVLRTLVPADAAPSSDEIVFPGEYEMQGIVIQGFPADHDSTDKYLKTIFLVSWEEMRFVFLGHLSKMPNEDTMEAIADPDILFVPTGEHFLSGPDAAKLIKKLEPAIAIPSFYKSPKEFLSAVGQKGTVEEKLVFKKKDIGDAKGRIVILEAKNG